MLNRTLILICNLFYVFVLEFYQILLTELNNLYNFQTLSHVDLKSFISYIPVVCIFNVLSVHKAQCSLQCWIMQRIIIKLT